MSTFDHEKLDVYHAALGFVALVSDWIDRIPSKRGSIADQLNRASSSIALNIAEGAGEFSKPEKARFYRMAKRSATECASALDVCLIHKVLDAASVERGKQILLKVVSMLVRMIQSVEAAGRQGEDDKGHGMGKRQGEDEKSTGREEEKGQGMGKRQGEDEKGKGRGKGKGMGEEVRDTP